MPTNLCRSILSGGSINMFDWSDCPSLSELPVSDVGLPRTPKAALTSHATQGRRPRNKKARIGVVGRTEVAETKQKTLAVGSACSGWMAGTQALEKLGRHHEVLFACDTSHWVREFIRANFAVGNMVHSVYDDAFARLPHCDIFECGFPCQPYSMEGARKGMADCRASTIKPVLKYIGLRRPTVVILENVPHFQGSPAYSKVLSQLRRVTDGSYVIKDGILDSRNFGVPQNRKRWFLVAVQRYALHTQLDFPTGSDVCVPLSGIYDLSSTASPAEEPHQAIARQHVANALALCKASGTKAHKRPFVIDVGHGRKNDRGQDLVHMTYNCLPTITATRASSRDYYFTQLRRRARLVELARAQGAISRLNLQCISARQMGHIVGNAITIPVLAALLKAVIECTHFG